LLSVNCAKLGKSLIRQGEFGSGQILKQLTDRRRARDQKDVARAMQEPGKR
jgi:hypothetical protein